MGHPRDLTAVRGSAGLRGIMAEDTSSLLCDIINETHGNKCATEEVNNTLLEILKVLKEIEKHLKEQ
jgi:hypothetical protein